MELDIASYMSLSVSFFNQHCHLIHCIEYGQVCTSFPAFLPTNPAPSAPQILKTKTVLKVMIIR